MARKVRIEYSGAIYHVINRGNRRAIFHNNQDREPFCETPAKELNRLRRETTMTLNWIAGKLNMGTAGSLGNLPRDSGGK